MMNRMGLKRSVYDGEMCLGELEAVNERNSFQFPNNKILIHHFSPQSDRCAPLAILQTISPYSVMCKLESSVPYEQPHLINLHSTCFYQSKTAVILVGDEEIHMVAMPSRQKKFPCFWCCSAPKGLYAASLGMLNPRCLAIVFDLDETLIVANTNKSFEDKIEALKPWIARENDPHKHSMMVAELKRLIDERALLMMYSENDSVKLMDNGNVVKAQMEEVPPLSDSHVKLVRPVIRLPERNLVLTRINPEVRDTSVLVRLRPAWDDLRNYLNAKGRKRFEVYVCTMAERDYALEMWRLLDPEAHLINLKQLPDRVCCVKAGSKKSLLNVFQSGVCHPKMGMVIDDRIKVWEDRDQPRVHVVPQFAPYFAPHAETAHPVPVLCVARNVACNVRGWFYREFDESFLRKIVETLYEDDVGNLPQAPDVSNFMVSEDAGFIPNGISHAPIAEGMSGAEVERRINHSDGKKVVDPAPQSMNFTANSRAVVAQPVGPVLPNPVGLKSSGNLLPSQKGVSHNQASSNTRELQNGSGRTNPDPSPPFISVLQYIGRVCDVKIDFRPVISTSHHVQFTVEVLYEGEKIGVGMGKTRKDAQQQAAENALHFLADGYDQYMMSVAGAAEATDPDTISLGNENGFLMDVDDSGKDEVLEQGLAKESTSKIRSGDCLARNHSLFGFFSTPRSVSPYNGGGMS